MDRGSVGVPPWRKDTPQTHKRMKQLGDMDERLETLIQYDNEMARQNYLLIRLRDEGWKVMEDARLERKEMRKTLGDRGLRLD